MNQTYFTKSMNEIVMAQMRMDKDEVYDEFLKEITIIEWRIFLEES